MATKQITAALNLPEKEPYEGKATQKQKQKIWSLGYQDTAVIDGLGKKQASAVIDQLNAIYGHEIKRRKAIKTLIAALILFFGSFVIGAINNSLAALAGLGVIISVILAISGGLSLLFSAATKPRTLK